MTITKINEEKFDSTTFEYEEKYENSRGTIILSPGIGIYDSTRNEMTFIHSNNNRKQIMSLYVLNSDTIKGKKIRQNLDTNVYTVYISYWKKV